jgi:hypothetical protein
MDVVLCAQGIPRRLSLPASPPFRSWMAPLLLHLVPITQTLHHPNNSLQKSTLMPSHLPNLCRLSLFAQLKTLLASSSSTLSKTKTNLLPQLVPSTFPSGSVLMPSNNPTLQNYQPLLLSPTVSYKWSDAHASLAYTLIANLWFKFGSPITRLPSSMAVQIHVSQAILASWLEWSISHHSPSRWPSKTVNPPSTTAAQNEGPYR